MGRKLTPDGRRTVVGVRLSDNDIRRLDEMRGGVPRAEFAYAVLKNTLGGIIPAAPDPEIPPARPARAVKAAAAGGTPASPLAPEVRAGRFACCSHCPHPLRPEGHDQKCTRCR